MFWVLYFEEKTSIHKYLLLYWSFPPFPSFQHGVGLPHSLLSVLLHFPLTLHVMSSSHLGTIFPPSRKILFKPFEENRYLLI